MCLNTLDLQYSNIPADEVRDAWKCIDPSDRGDWSTVCRFKIVYHSYDQWLQRHWNGVNLVRTEDDQWYEPGWHVFVNLEDAIAYSEDGTFLVVPVKVRGILCGGDQDNDDGNDGHGPALVARELYVPRPIDLEGFLEHRR